jgi:hypothetical protein
VWSSLLVDLLAVHTSSLGHDLGRIVDGTECAPGRVHALPHEEARNDDPKGIHEHEVAPVIGGLRARVCNVEDIVVEHGGRVVEDVAVELAERDDELERVAERVVVGDENSADEGERTPEGLSHQVSTRCDTRERARRHTAVTVSMQSTKASCVRYLESLKLYSFHSWPNKSCMLPMVLKL